MQTWSCLFPCRIKIGNEKDRHILFWRFQSVWGLTISLGTQLVSNLLVSSLHRLCDPSLSPRITAPLDCRKCLGVFTGENEGSTKIFSISTETNFTLHSCSVSAVPQRPSRIWLRYTETWLIFYEHSFSWYIFKGTAYISIMWKKWRLLFWQE